MSEVSDGKKASSKMIFGFLKNSVISAPLLALFVLLLVRLSSVLVEKNAENGEMLLVITIAQAVIFLIPASFYYHAKGRKLSSSMFIALIKPQQIIFVCFSFLLLVCGNIIIKYFLFRYSGYYSDGVSFYSSASALSYNKFFMVIAFCVAPAICEEVFFRGVLLSEYRRYGATNAVIISSLYFTLMHFSFNDFLPCFFSGVVFGVATTVCRSVLPAIILHFFSNFLSIYGSDAFLRIAGYQAGIEFVSIVLITLFLLSLIFMLSRLEYVYEVYAQKPPVEELPPRSLDSLLAVYVSPTFIASAVILLLFIILGE